MDDEGWDSSFNCFSWMMMSSIATVLCKSGVGVLFIKVCTDIYSSESADFGTIFVCASICDVSSENKELKCLTMLI